MTVQARLVEDDAALRALLADHLIRYGIAMTVAATAAELKRLLHPGAAAPFDVLLLDLMLPDGRGLALCRWVRQHHVPPILMLTAQGDPAGRVVGLEMGADDYLPKPFEPRRRVAHGWAVLLRSAAPTAALRVPFNGWTVDRLQRQRVSPMQVDRGRICLAHRDTGVACAPRCGGPALRNHPPGPMPSLTAHIPTTPEAPHDHDHGLGHDLQVMQTGIAERRRLLRWMAGTGIGLDGLPLFGCGGCGDSGSARNLAAISFATDTVLSDGVSLQTATVTGSAAAG